MALKITPTAPVPTPAPQVPSGKTETRSFIHIGDAHLRRGAWLSRPGLVGDAFHAFRQVITYAIQNQLNIVSSGDLFNSTRPASEEIQFFNQEMRRLQQAGRTFYKIDGNHEITSPSWAETGLNGTVIDIDTQVFEVVPGVKAYGLASRAMPTLHEAFGKIPADISILFCHQLMDWAFKLSHSWNMEHRNVPPHIRLTLASDLHYAIEHCREDTGQVFAYNGSLCMQNVAEAIEKSFMVVTAWADNSLTYSRIPLTGRPVYRDKAMDADHFEQLLLKVVDVVNPNRYTHLPEDLRKPMVVVEVSSMIDRAAKRLEETVGELGFLFLDTVNTELVAPEIDMTPASVATSDVLATLIDPHEQPDAYSLALDLLMNPDPVATIAAFRERHLGSSTELPPAPPAPIAPK